MRKKSMILEKTNNFRMSVAFLPEHDCSIVIQISLEWIGEKDMTMQQFHNYKEQQFDAFCKAIIRNKSADAHRALSKRFAREISVENMIFAELSSLQISDEYHPDATSFWVQGRRVIVSNWALGQALRSLPPYRRDVILLSYFMECSDSQIGKLLNMDTRTVCSRRTAALERLSCLLEDLADETN